MSKAPKTISAIPLKYTIPSLNGKIGGTILTYQSGLKKWFNPAMI
jgi:hypothetical protein